MKRSTLLICPLVFLFVFVHIVFASDRMVLAELFTNTSCSTCNPANAELDIIANEYVDDLVVIRYHTWWPSEFDPYYVYNSSENTARTNYYSTGYTPRLIADGTVDCQHLYSTWENRLTNEMHSGSPVKILLSGTYDSVARVGTINVRLIATESISESDLKLRIALTESNIRWAAPNGSTRHHQTFRDMITTTSGISVTINEGDTLDFSRAFNCPSPLVSNNCHLVAFLQSDTDKSVLQAAKISLTDIGYVLSPFTLISPFDDTTLAFCNPYFIWHATEDEDSGYAVSYQVEVSVNSDFSNAIISDELVDTVWDCFICLQDDVTYYWRVKASTGHTPDRYSTDVFTFMIDEGEIQISPPGVTDIYAVSDEVKEFDLRIFNNSYFEIEYNLSESSGFIEIDNYPGELGALEVDTIKISISAAGLFPGIYIDTITVQTNHPITSMLKMPIELQVYIQGDVNCDNRLVGGDVTYLVNYFRGIVGTICDPPLRGDMNGDCSVVGSDVTYLVNYFRGLVPAPVPGDCD